MLRETSADKTDYWAMDMKSTLVLGGARSGKSRRAQALVEAAAAQRIYLATAQAFDEEMRERIARHQGERDGSWQTVDTPLELVSTLQDLKDSQRAVLVDCLTLWLSNLMLGGRDVAAETAGLCAAIGEMKTPVCLVSNEVGMGLVPETPLGRAFRDEQGRLNQRVAEVVDRVEFVAAGLPLVLKG